MAKLGLELRLLSSDMDTEVEKWEEQEHDIVRQSQSLASMTYNMYLFTRLAYSYHTLHSLTFYICSLLNCSHSFQSSKL